MAVSPKGSESVAEVVQAATQLFAHQGYHGTSTREIARLAGISENTLFRHFEHKEDIFLSALQAALDGIKLRKELVEGMAACEPPEVVFPQVFSLLVDTVTFRPQLLSLLAVAMIELRWKAETICQKHLSPLFAIFHEYLVRNMESGHVRKLDPSMVISALAMTVMVQPHVSRMISGMPPQHADLRETIRAFTKFWLELLVPVGPVALRSPIEPSSRSA
jgi:AcrR family transcriptional regulator